MKEKKILLVHFSFIFYKLSTPYLGKGQNLHAPPRMVPNYVPEFSLSLMPTDKRFNPYNSKIKLIIEFNCMKNIGASFINLV